MNRFKISDKDRTHPINVVVETCGHDVSLELTDDDGENYELAILSPTDARLVANALDCAAGAISRERSLPAAKQPDGYIVSHAPITDAKMLQVPPYKPLPVLRSYFTTLDEAKAKAEAWATEYKRGYTVYAVTEIGTAAPPAAPAVVWTEK